MLNQSKRRIEFTFSNLGVFESRDHLHYRLELIAILHICVDGKPTIFYRWLIIKSSWVFFKGCFEIFWLCGIISYKAVNCTWSRFRFRRRTVRWIKVWPLQFNVPFVSYAIDYRSLYFYVSLYFGNYIGHLLIILYIYLDNKYVTVSCFQKEHGRDKRFLTHFPYLTMTIPLRSSRFL